MSKLTLIDPSVVNQSLAPTIVGNNTAIETAIENTLSRDGTSPNEMNSILDMNNHSIINLPDAVTSQEPATLSQLEARLAEWQTENLFDISTRVEYWAEDFGVVSGNTDDLTICQANLTAVVSAIAQISAAGGGVLRFKGRTYSFARVSNVVGIILRNNVYLRGDGMGATTLRLRNGNGTLHFIGPDSVNGTLINSGLMDLTVDHNGPNMSGTAVGCHAVRLSDVNGFLISNVCVKNSKQHSIATLGAVGDDFTRINKNIFINNYYCLNSGEDGLRIFYAAENVVANNILIRGAQLHAIHIAYGSCNISNVTVYNVAGTAISPQSDGCNISNVHAEWTITNDLLANRPAAGNPSALFRDSATGILYYDNGVTWVNHGTGLVNGIWAITRGGGWPTGGKSNYNNIKVILNITENQPYVYDGTTADGFRLDVPNCECSNIIVTGKFRFGLYTTVGGNNISNILVSGMQDDGIRLIGDQNILDGWRVLSAINKAVHIYSSYNKIINGYALDAVNVVTAIVEESGADWNIITGNHLVSSSNRLSLSGQNTQVYGNTGVSYEYRDVSTSTAPADTSENILKSTALRTAEFKPGETIIIRGWGQCSGTSGTKTIKAFIGNVDVTVSSQTSGEQQDWYFNAFVTRGVGTTYAIQVFYSEEGGTSSFSGSYNSISSNWSTGIKATKGDSGDSITALGFVVTKNIC